MNQKSDNNVCKIILEEDKNGSLFVKSLQGFTDQLLRGTEYKELLKKSPTMVTKNGVIASMSCNSANQIKIKAIKNGKHYDLAERYPTPQAAPAPRDTRRLTENEHYEAVADFLNYFGVECNNLEEYRYVESYLEPEVNDDDDIEILLDEKEDFEANFDRYLMEMLDEEFEKIDVTPNNSVKKM